MILTIKEGKQNKVHLFLDGEYRMTVDRDFLALSGFRNNEVLTEDALEDLTAQVQARRAFNKACDLLARRDHSRAELLIKLRQRGYADGAEDAVERLAELGYLDDARFAAGYAAELQRSKQYGKRRIEQALLQKGVDRAVIRDTLDAMAFETDDLVALIERKYLRQLGDDAGVRRTINALVRYGYTYSEIKEALAAVLEETE